MEKRTEKKLEKNTEKEELKQPTFDIFDKIGFSIVILWGVLLSTTSIWSASIETDKSSFQIYRLVLAVFAILSVTLLHKIIKNKTTKNKMLLDKEQSGAILTKSEMLWKIGLFLSVPQFMISIIMLVLASLRDVQALLSMQGVLNIFMLYPVALLLIEVATVFYILHVEKRQGKIETHTEFENQVND